MGKKGNDLKPETKDAAEPVGPQKGDFIAPPEFEERDERADALPAQEEFWRPPTRFGSVPVEKEPLGWDRRKGFRKHFPQVMLPFQVVERVQFGHPKLEPNRLFWGDNVHVMRQLPSESIDLIYIDPPFFSGRQYNVIFGDQNELRSFSDIWEGGMPGYLIWLNARLYEMKRLLKRSGSIYVHLDWHAVHYVKVEMDKVFGNDNFRNEIIWQRFNYHADAKRFGAVHDTLLWYSKSDRYVYNKQFKPLDEKYKASHFTGKDPDGRVFRLDNPVGAGQGPARRFGDTVIDPPPGTHWRYSQENIDEMLERGRIVMTSKGTPTMKRYLDEIEGATVHTLWIDIPPINSQARERIGYPTQKPEKLLERMIGATTSEGGIVADFFCGGGTTAAVAQRLGRRWIACDQSRVAVAITADRLTRQVEEQTGKLLPVPDFTVEHWGVYETRRLAEAPVDQFRAFVLKCFGAVTEEPSPRLRGERGGPLAERSPTPALPASGEGAIHGYKGAIPVWVGEPGQKKAVTAADVQAFANAMRKTLRYKQDNLRDGIMLAWAFRPDAQEAAERLRRLEHTDLNFIRLDMIRIDEPRFRQHIAVLSEGTKADYSNFLTFVQPPKVEEGHKRIGARIYVFDVSETAILNAGAKIINVQWDFDYGKRFSSTPGYSFVRGSKKEVALQAQYEFPSSGKKRIACKVQDDMGGEGLWTAEIEVV